MDRFQAIRDKFADVCALAHRLYGVNLSACQVSFALKGRMAGQCRCKIMAPTRVVSFRFNQEMIMGQDFVGMRDDTIPHEIAHGVCFMLPQLGKGHNSGWRQVCIALGGSGRKYHNFAVRPKGSAAPTIMIPPPRLGPTLIKPSVPVQSSTKPVNAHQQIMLIRGLIMAARRQNRDVDSVLAEVSKLGGDETLTRNMVQEQWQLI
jgi:hypothetical protein